MNTFDTVCNVKVRVGGKYLPRCHVMDGQKYVCMDELSNDIDNQECIVYSFGIGGDWTFEDTIASFGCKVYAYDPTINLPTFRSKNITFKKIGLSELPINDKFQTLSKIINENGHTNTKISYLKMDIEGAELSGLRVWIESGLLDNVQQIGMEVHLGEKNRMFTLPFLNTLRKLQLKANFRIFNWEANNCWKNVNRNEQYFSLAELVFKKINTKFECSR